MSSTRRGRTGILFLMKQEIHPAPAAPDASLKTLTLFALAWLTITCLGALQTYSDNLRVGVASHYPALLATWFVEYALPLVLLSTLLHLGLQRWSTLIARPRHVVMLFVGLVLAYQPMQWIYMAWLRGYLPVTSVDQVWALLMKMLLVGWFSTTATFAAVLAMHYWRQVRERERALQSSQTEMLEWRLAFEAQRALALRAQLEPHFLFNALSAISALVREGDQRLALSGIARLSDLLRYALGASASEETSVGAELQFVRDYLDLQRLRYGARLQVRIEGAGNDLEQVRCAPLLLQPLVENALRHDLDCHAGDSDIKLRFLRQGQSLLIQVTNPVGAHPASNPGTGLGLMNIRERLALMHDEAQLHTHVDALRFIAEVRLPLALA